MTHFADFATVSRGDDPQKGNEMKKLLIAALKEAARAAVSAFLTAIGVTTILSATGCTSVLVPNDDAKSVTVTGALPVGFQFNCGGNR